MAAHDEAVDGISDPGFSSGAPLAQRTAECDAFENAIVPNAWCNGLAAEIVAAFRTQLCPFGNGANRLERTAIPFVTVGSAYGHGFIGCLRFGSALGRSHAGADSRTSRSGPRFHDDFGLGVAQPSVGAAALFQLAERRFLKTDVAPIPGHWTVPT